MPAVRFNKLTFIRLFFLSFAILCAEEDVARRHQVAINPPKHMPQEGQVDVYASASFIYWRAIPAGESYAYSNSSEISMPAEGVTYYPKYYTKPGFKVGIGMVVDHDGWQVDLDYTWNRWNTSNSDKFSLTLPDSIGLVNKFGFDNPGSLSNGYWNFELNRWDLSLGRPFFTGNWHSTYPYISLMGYVNESNCGVESDDPGSFHMKQKFGGVGPAFGVERAFCVNKPFSIFGDIKLSLPYNHFRSHTTFQGQHLTQPDFINNGNKNYHLNQIIDLVIGLRYESRWDHYFASLQAGWENQIWINFLDANDVPYINSKKHDLSLTGLTLKAMLMF